ncbi:MAG: ABC transporter ATP-binding protein [Chloroflexota bacterium]
MENVAPVLEAKGVSIEYKIGSRWLSAVKDVTLTINPLQIHGLVGESGSGKSTLGLGLMKYLDRNARITSGTIVFDGEDITGYSPAQMRRIWGSRIGLVPQNPLDSLNPSLRIGQQMTELTELHMEISHSEARQNALDMLSSVKIADPERILDKYPHQLSGGMQQRVMIALALSTRPRLLVLDEPTTALDVTTQAVILDLVRELIKSENAAALYVSHDLGTVAQQCDYVTVLYAGEKMEGAPVADLFDAALHPYTSGLLASLPGGVNAADRLSTIDGVAPGLSERPSTCVFAPRCPVGIDKCTQEKPPLELTPDGRRMVRCWRWEEIASGELIPRNRPQGAAAAADVESGGVLYTYDINKDFGNETFLDRVTGTDPEIVHAVDDVSIKINRRSTFGLVGESGSGKTTLARVIVALHEATSGKIELLEAAVSNDIGERSRVEMRNLQMVFQNPHDALNPHLTVGTAIGRTLTILSDGKLSRYERNMEVARLLRAVGLTEEYARRYPTQLSGGEKQRVAIARAFAANPAVVVADEPTSSLDVSVQAVILNLLKDLRADQGASYLLISHDLDVITYLADWIVVMYLGQIVEQGTSEQLVAPPMHPYTEALLSAIPVPDPSVDGGRIRLDGDVPSPRNRPSGCPFHTRCPRYIGDICKDEEPPIRETTDGHEYRCHYTPSELIELQAIMEES